MDTLLEALLSPSGKWVSEIEWGGGKRWQNVDLNCFSVLRIEVVCDKREMKSFLVAINSSPAAQAATQSLLLQIELKKKGGGSAGSSQKSCLSKACGISPRGTM